MNYQIWKDEKLGRIKAQLELNAKRQEEWEQDRQSHACLSRAGWKRRWTKEKRVNSLLTVSQILDLLSWKDCDFDIGVWGS